MVEGNLKYLKAQRRGHKAYATWLINEAENYFPAAEENIVKMRTLVTVIGERMEIIGGLDNNILSDLIDEDEIENEVNIAELFKKF